ncbi:MAG: AraC family transcriptional regulator [Oscillospiraceae bacterium]|nr:AraC family transcriptional regulator [Oscillospiraceae bacterium]
MEKIIHEKDMYIRQNKEQDISKTYEQDRMYLQRIRTGDVAAILRDRERREMALPPGKSVPAPQRHVEYKVCAAITLAAYAAIEGGLDRASAYAFNDLFLQRLERCRDSAEMTQLHDEMELLFAKQVSLVRQKRSQASYVEKCKLFIEQHLGKPFTLDDIAKALHINKSHLSRRFAQESGGPIMEYTRQKRIEAAANMLKYTDQTIAAIAAMFCFPTQSHFGELFKKIMGITPLKYRSAHQIIEVGTAE